MRPDRIRSRIFLGGGDTGETKEVTHELTDKRMEKFSEDCNSMIKR